MLKLFLFIFIFLTFVDARGNQPNQYIWFPKHNMEQKSSWLNENLPCEDDLIAFDQQKLAVSYISGGLKSEGLLLPDNGVIFMDNYAIIGEKADWQCPKRSEKTEVFFQPRDSLPNIFDWKNWKINEKLNDGRPKLHCDRIPSELDEANFPIDSSFRAEVDAPLVVGKLNYSNQVSFRF
uniref:Protein amnionless n=1 Tax=Panagrolaimus davidi TaxID=227884 RepID=A0A914QZD9_9BILA